MREKSEQEVYWPAFVVRYFLILPMLRILFYKYPALSTDEMYGFIDMSESMMTPKLRTWILETWADDNKFRRIYISYRALVLNSGFWAC